MFSKLNFRNNARSVILFLIPRYPFAQALSLLLFIAERAHKDQNPPFPPNAIYTFVFLLFACGVGTSVSSIKPYCAALASAILLSSGGIVYFNQSLDYRYWVKFRMVHGLIGAASALLMFSFFSFDKPRPQKLWKFTGILMAFYSATQCYILLRSAEDKTAFTQFVPYTNTSLFIYMLLHGTVALCLFTNVHVYDFHVILGVLVAFKLLLVDLQISYWHKRRGLDFWNQMRLIIDHVTLLLGVLLYLVSVRRHTPQHQKI
ncbi:hypothetical protein HELRODRAFT_180314 [Helobdella robusta]|uniref:Transmembrane protein 101 n=1 Tax=Helobdella robusta TaxID=6412 RepID=T1FFQ3_HELRO|nr:hypothetical protein HELRODRAFT_180314 [Helobdella robusta]ESN94143.1 hypothetical protein HELRODRAFT_180314 [Helobdella robusta]